MADARDKAKLLQQIAARTDLSEAERTVLLEAAKRFQGDARPRRPRAARAPEPSALTAAPVALEAVLSTDGACRGNPGPSGIGAHLVSSSGKLLAEVSEYLGQATNNVAEYRALIAGVERALEHGVRRLTVRADSEVVIKQLRGEYQVRDEKLKPLYASAQRLLGKLEHVELRHVPRAQNQEADALANLAIDGAMGK